MDIIYLNDLRIETVIGVFDWERRIKQTVILDLELGYDIRRAGQTDDLADTLDYGKVAERTRAFVENSQYQLVEALAENLAQLLLREFSLPWLRLKINKQGAVPGVNGIGVIIERIRGSIA